MSYVDINKLVNENYDAIKNKTYKWSDDEVRAIYKLAYNTLKSFDIRNDDLEDYIEDCLYTFFNSVITYYNKDLGNNISTLATVAFKRTYLESLRKQENQCETVSLYKDIGEDLILEDILYDKVV